MNVASWNALKSGVFVTDGARWHRVHVPEQVVREGRPKRIDLYLEGEGTPRTTINNGRYHVLDQTRSMTL